MIKNKKIKFFVLVLVLLMLVLPVMSTAQSLVPCDGSTAEPCDFNAFMKLINNVIHFVLFNLALPIAAIMFAYAGFLLVTAGGETAGARTKAKSIFTNALIGLAIAAAAWLIVRLILVILGFDGSFFGF